MFHTWSRKTKVIQLPFPMQDDGCEVPRKASTGYVPPCSEGQGGNLTDSEVCSLLCHLLLEQQDCTPAIAQGLWKSYGVVPVLTGCSFLGLYLALLEGRGVLLVVTSTKTCDSISNGIWFPWTTASCDSLQHPQLPASNFPSNF